VLEEYSAMADNLEVRLRREGPVGIVETEGYINSIGAEKVAEACDSHIEDGLKFLALNLEKSRIINSIGISILIEVIEKVKELDGKVAFCCVTSTIGKTFRIMGLLQVADLYDTEKEAMEALGKLAQ